MENPGVYEVAMWIIDVLTRPGKSDEEVGAYLDLHTSWRSHRTRVASRIFVIPYGQIFACIRGCYRIEATRKTICISWGIPHEQFV